MTLQSVFLIFGVLLTSIGFANEPKIDRNAPEYLELLAEALDKKSTQPISPVVIEDLKCRFLVYDIAASLLGLDEEDALFAGLIQEALKIKVYNNDYSKLLDWWQLHKGPVNTVKLCPETKDFVAKLVKAAN